MGKSQLSTFFPTAPSILERRKVDKYCENDQSHQTVLVNQYSSISVHARKQSKSHDTHLNDSLSNSHESVDVMQVDEQDSSNGDMLNGAESASSSTTVESIFSDKISRPIGPIASIMTSTTLTPLTNTESSPHTKMISPSSDQHDTRNGLYSARGNITPQPTPPAMTNRKSARSQELEVKGRKCTYDPDLDKKASKDKRKKATFEDFGGKPEDNVSPDDPRLAIAGYRKGFSGKGKARLRHAPYMFKYWQSEPVSLTPATPQPTSVVVTGFDPMTPLAQITALFSSFGDISDIDNKIDPGTGRFLGICVIVYQDCASFQGGGPVSAQLAAKQAFQEGKRGQRIGLKTINIQLERDGMVKKMTDVCIAKHRKEIGFSNTPRPSIPPPPAERPPAPSGFAKVDGPPPTAPKGPAAKSHLRPNPVSSPVPQASLTLHNKTVEQKREEKPAGPLKVEEDVADSLKNQPYIFIGQEHVPVLSSTIPHLKKRLRMYDWRDIRCDKTGYFLVFEGSRNGQTEAKKTYHGAHMHPLFTYVMHMSLNLNGAVIPATAPAAMHQQIQQMPPATGATPYELLTYKQKLRAQREKDFELEEEKRQRAKDLDPCRAVVQLVVQELREKLLQDVKSRIAAPLLYEYLDPDRHVDKRRRLGIEDPPDARRQNVSEGFAVRRPVKPITMAGLPQIGKKTGTERGTGFRDERRKAPAPRPAVRSLFHQLSQFHEEEESDDENRTSITRDTEDVESRPASRMSMTSVSSDEELIRKVQKKKYNHARDDSEFGDAPVKEDPAALKKSADDLIILKLERAIGDLPASSRKRKKLAKELEARKRQKADDELFGVEKAEKEREGSAEPQVKEAETPTEATPEPEVTKIKKTKPKKKTKKEIAAEKEAARLAQAEAEAAAVLEDVMDLVDEEEALLEAAERRPEVEWGVSADHPQPTVEDDEDLVPDIRGWQASLVDDEDLSLLADVLHQKLPSKIGNSTAWAWKQEQIRNQSRNFQPGAIRRESVIQGYYKPNSTGSARTEGVKKILESEKSMYLPHRLKVQKDRERREAEAKLATGPNAQIKAVAEVPKASSRGRRADDRRTVKDIDRQREMLKDHGDDADVVGYNQLQKRKKPVRFDRSAIHNWGLYTKERIQAQEMIIEYVGERIRQEIADLREIRYTESGIGSSYLFRIDEGTVVDATKKGGIARFINHSCNPNCTAKIIRVGSTKRIVIYALRDIGKGESSCV